uniref:Uncharacterized protein n=1 Tax=Pseudomonas phage RVTF4 TaxID=3236931 RepID=A0AB39CCZ5_9VIRU
MAALALPSFLGSPEDATKVVDAYGETSSEQRSALSSKIDSFTSGLGDVFDKAVGITKGIGEKLRTNVVDLPSAMKRIDRALKGSRTDIVSLAKSTEKLIMGELTGTDANTNYVKTATDVARGLELMTSDGKQLIDSFKNGGYDQVSAMVGFIGDLTNNPAIKLFDLGAEAAVLRGVLDEVSSWGIPQLVDDVLKQQPDRTKYAVIKRSASRISASSSLDVLLAYAKVNNSTQIGCKAGTGGENKDDEGNLIPCEPIYGNLGAGALQAAVPDFATKVLSNFAFVDGITPGDYPSQLAKLEELLNLLKPDWFWTRRGTQAVWNLGPIAQASEDAVKLFLSSDKYRNAMLTAPFYQPLRIDELVNTMYPLTTD